MCTYQCYSLNLSFPLGCPGSSAGKESACNAGGPSLIPGLGRSHGEGVRYPLQYSWASLLAQLVKNHLQWRRPGFNPWVWKILWRREWLPTPVPLPGKSYGQRSLVGCSPWGGKESDTTEQLSLTPSPAASTSPFSICISFPALHHFSRCHTIILICIPLIYLAILLLGIYPEKTIIQKDTCIPVFTEALFTIVRGWKKPRCSLTDEWIKRLWFIYMMDYYSAIKGNEFESVGVSWMNLESVTQSEVSTIYWIDCTCWVTVILHMN